MAGHVGTYHAFAASLLMTAFSCWDYHWAAPGC
jgi:hypothetical protein